MDELKMSLDEIAAQNRKKSRQSRGRLGLRRGRIHRASSSSQRGRYNSYSKPHSTYRQRRFTNKQSRGVRKPTPSKGRRLLLTNLNKELTNDKLKQLFEQYGKLTRCGIHFDKMGDSKGTADIEYATHEEAEKAIKEMNKADINGVTVDVKYKPRKRQASSSMRMGRRNANVTLRRTKIRRQIARRRVVNNNNHSRGGRRRTLGNDDNHQRRRRNRMNGNGSIKYRRFKNSLGTRRRRN